jgi:hypoxanthine-DNA glycosylase
MSTVYSFPAIAATDARVLILGSMPGEVSLAKQQYYAHPRNSFWFIIEQLFNASAPLEYEHRIQLLMDNNIALWDVLKACVRKGSLDASIKNDSIVANEFETFFSRHTDIKAVFFNGAKAEKEFIKHVMPLQGIQSLGLEYHRLPSTSPAHAAMSREQKLLAWRLVSDRSHPA